jgi:hypothetical protein
MKRPVTPYPLIKDNGQVRRCLSCGTTERMKRRRYCSIECRQKLRYNLNMRTGLLQTLQIRYATFYFTETLIVLDMLPYGAADLVSFIFPRANGKKPVEDFCKMFNLLGNAWWEEVRRTKKRYLATRIILGKAKPIEGDINSVRPLEVREPARMARSDHPEAQTRGPALAEPTADHQTRFPASGETSPRSGRGCGPFPQAARCLRAVINGRKPHVYDPPRLADRVVL